ncbi:hypothetical protein ABBZ21_19715 [Acinetobacter baumannii]|uniref:hypothetical protein n=1 Tax=Acinetobacter baumannii TaxID=470 RepID=UPI00385C1F7C
MKEKNYSLSTSALIVIVPWLVFALAGGLFGKYRDNIQVPFNFAIKYGLIWAVVLLGVAFITYILSLHNQKLKVWIGTALKMSLVTFMFVLIVWYLRPEYSSVMERF